MKVQELFEKHNDREHGRFERIENPSCKRPDLYAMMILDRLCPDGEEDMIAWAEHDEFTFAISADQLEGVATEEDIIALIRCGVMLGGDRNTALFMFA